MKRIPASHRALAARLLEEAQRLGSKAAWIRDVNRAYPGEAHNMGAALAAIADATMALNLAESLLRADHTTVRPKAAGALKQAAA